MPGIAFRIVPHSGKPDVNLVEVARDGRLLATIYAEAAGTAASVTVISKHLVSSIHDHSVREVPTVALMLRLPAPAD